MGKISSNQRIKSRFQNQNRDETEMRIGNENWK